jgi:hypothetical protein
VPPTLSGGSPTAGLAASAALGRTTDALGRTTDALDLPDGAAHRGQRGGRAAAVLGRLNPGGSPP